MIRVTYFEYQKSKSPPALSPQMMLRDVLVWNGWFSPFVWMSRVVSCIRTGADHHSFICIQEREGNGYRRPAAIVSMTTSRYGLAASADRSPSPPLPSQGPSWLQQVPLLKAPLGCSSAFLRDRCKIHKLSVFPGANSLINSASRTLPWLELCVLQPGGSLGDVSEDPVHGRTAWFTVIPRRSRVGLADW